MRTFGGNMKFYENMYMHTIDGQPAEFYKGCIVYAYKWRAIILVDSREQIKKEQRLSTKWRKEQNLKPYTLAYGHFRVQVPINA